MHTVRVEMQRRAAIEKPTVAKTRRRASPLARDDHAEYQPVGAAGRGVRALTRDG